MVKGRRTYVEFFSPCFQRVGAHFMSPRNLPNAVCLDHAPTLQSWYTKQSSRKAKANVPDKEVETTKETMDESALQHVTTEQQKLDLAHKSTHGNQDFDVDMDLGEVLFLICVLFIFKACH